MKKSPGGFSCRGRPGAGAPITGSSRRERQYTRQYMTVTENNQEQERKESMKKMKKILAFVMAMAMVLGMSVTSFAATKATGQSEFGKEGDKGSIKISGIDKEDGIEIKLYPVVEAKYDEATKVFIGYDVVKATDGVTNLYTVEKDADGNYAIDQTTLDAIGATALTSGTALTGVEWVYDEATKVYKTKTDCVPVGMYLVDITGAETKIYNYAVASLFYTVKDGGNDLQDGALNLQDGSAIVKVSSHPEVEKNAKDSAGNAVHSVNIGDRIPYELVITDVPYYGGEHPVFDLVDTLSEGLTFQNDVVVVATKKTGDVVSLTEDTDYTVTTYADVQKKAEADRTEKEKALQDGQVLINFVIDGEYMLNAYAGGSVKVTYSAILNDDAVINQGGNTNGVVLNYAKDSKVDGGDEGSTEESKTYTYTFDIDGGINGDNTTNNINTAFLVKTDGTVVWSSEDVDSRTVKNPLKGAKFGLYTDEACTKLYTRKEVKDADGNTIVTAFDGIVESETNGLLVIEGLKAGTIADPVVYYLKETEAPQGYTLNTNVFKISIGADYYDAKGNGFDKGQLKSWTIKINDNEATTFTVKNDGGTITTTHDDVTVTAIPNTTLSTLPSTGGIGTTIFTIGGCVIMIIAAGLFFATRRKAEK